MAQVMEALRLDVRIPASTAITPTAWSRSKHEVAKPQKRKREQIAALPNQLDD